MANLKRLSILLLGLAFAGTGSMAWASPFGSGEAGVLLDNTFTDLDLGLLTQFFGYDTTSILNYGAAITSTGFTAHLSGTYAGQSLNVTYTSIDLATFPGSPVTWTSTGSYGALSWSGSGSAQFAFPTSSTLPRLTAPRFRWVPAWTQVLTRSASAATLAVLWNTPTATV